MKNPNGYGNISKLPGNRRNPYRVRVTDHWEIDEQTGRSRQVFRTIGYYATKESALEALNLYHKNPVLATSTATFREVYEEWSEQHFPKIGKSSISSYKAAYNSCGSLYNMRFADIRLAQLQNVIDTCGKNYPSLAKIKNLMNQLFEYAMQNDICIKDYSDYVDIGYENYEPEDKHKAFTRDEIKTLWDHADESQNIRIILILMCCGVRIGELLNLKKEDVFLSDRYFKVKQAKTKSGIRIVPIAECVFPFWEELMQSESIYVIAHHSDNSRRMRYEYYQSNCFNPAMVHAGLSEHYPHDTRHTFTSVMNGAGINKFFIKRIIGHKGNDVTERVYTHAEISDLIEAVNTPDFRNPKLDLITKV